MSSWPSPFHWARPAPFPFALSSDPVPLALPRLGPTNTLVMLLLLSARIHVFPHSGAMRLSASLPPLLRFGRSTSSLPPPLSRPAPATSPALPPAPSHRRPSSLGLSVFSRSVRASCPLGVWPFVLAPFPLFRWPPPPSLQPGGPCLSTRPRVGLAPLLPISFLAPFPPSSLLTPPSPSHFSPRGSPWPPCPLLPFPPSFCSRHPPLGPLGFYLSLYPSPSCPPGTFALRWLLHGRLLTRTVCPLNPVAGLLCPGRLRGPRHLLL